MLKNYILIIFSASFLCSCVSPPRGENYTNEILQGLKKDSTIKYARRFSISENEYCKAVYLFGNRNINDTTATYILLKDSSVKINPRQNSYVLKSPCKKMASLSSVYTAMLCELNEIDHIAAIENVDYYNNQQVLDKFNNGHLAELMKAPAIDIEKTVVLNPNIIFTFGMGNSEKNMNEKIIQAKIPLAVAVDHLEETPLARAEWIKFFAAFVNKKQVADSVFNQVEKNYSELKKVAYTSKTFPSVFTEIKFGEIWYVPGGKSFAATFIRDAHASYIWKDNDQTGSLHLSFEEVFTTAKDADYWLNMALVNSKKELFALENRYSEFKAYKTGNLYNNIKTKNNKGFSDYWETGIMYPDRVLHDLILIFHPELNNVIKNDLYYYKKLE